MSDSGVLLNQLNVKVRSFVIANRITSGNTESSDSTIKQSGTRNESMYL